MGRGSISEVDKNHGHNYHLVPRYIYNREIIEQCTLIGHKSFNYYSHYHLNTVNSCSLHS